MSPGLSIAHYRVTSKLGQGGMGEVYRATDTKLGREVAVKVLPANFAQDPERMARFEREAKVLASLNHPNIAQIFGVEDRALVMELVEGETLKGPLPLETALEYARQIADALEAAHEKGIVHRDLKPGNIMVTAAAVVKVLDFGLARMADEGTADSQNSPTLTISPTRAGVILGTAAYMSPEQARGKGVDKRADIWAFGCVVYEILTGKPAFGGETTTDILASVVKTEPDFTRVPVKVRRLIEWCLKKDPKQRLQAIGDWRLLLEEGVGTGTAALSHSRLNAAGWIAAGVLALLLGVGSILYFRRTPAPQVVTRFEYPLPEGQNFTRFGRHLLAISPDGSKLVYVANQQLYLREMDQLEAQPVSGTNEDPMEPVFSPDSQTIAYFVPAAAGAGATGNPWVLKKIAAAGGVPVTLGQLPTPPFGASWRKGTIVFGVNTAASAGGGAIPEPGGPLQTLVIGDPRKERIMQPQLLADGKHVLYVSVPVMSAEGEGEGEIVVQALDGKERRTLIAGGSDPRVLATGQLVYIHAGTLFAVPFHIGRLVVTGGPVPLLGGVREQGTTWAGQFAISPDGTLVFIPGSAPTGLSTLAGGRKALVWVDRQGHEEAVPAPLRAYMSPRLSPDGTKIAIDSADEQVDIWVFDLAKQTLTRLTFGGGFQSHPAWTPDGKYLLFCSGPSFPRPNVGGDIFRKAADGTGAVEALTQNLQGGYPLSIAPDGKTLVFRKMGPPGGLFALPLDGRSEAHVLPVDPKSSEFDGEISPDGHWLAYDSAESDHREIYVRPFPAVDSGRWQISTEGGQDPVWARSGRELFFVTAKGQMVAVPVQAGSSFSYGKPQPLFEIAGWFLAPISRPFDISPDGKRFLMLKDAGSGNTTARPSIVVVLHWFDEVNRRVGAGGK